MFAGSKTRIAAALIWVLVPLTVFAGLPRTGCICANGQHKFFCQRSRIDGPERLCSCCYGKNPSRAAANAADGTRTCCGQGRGSPIGVAGVASDRPCRPVLEHSVFVPGQKAPALKLDRASHCLVFADFEPRPALVSSARHDFDRRELLPPPDLVITLGVLLI